MLDLLQNTTHQIFNLYRQYGKSWYNFSLYYALTVGLFCVILAAGTWKLAYYFHSYFQESRDFFSYGYHDIRFLRITISLSVLSFGLYAFYLFKKLNEEDKTPSIKDFFSLIQTNVMTDFMLSALLVVIIYLATFEGVFVSGAGSPEMFGLMSDFSDAENLDWRLYTWLNSIIFFIRDYSIFPLAGIIFLGTQNYKISRELILQYKISFLTILVVYFCVDAIAGGVIRLLHMYVFEGVGIIFRDAILIVPLQLLISIVIFSYFYLGFAGAVLFPIILNKQFGAKQKIIEEVKSI